MKKKSHIGNLWPSNCTFELVMKRRVTIDLSSRDCSSALRGEEDRSLVFSIAATATTSQLSVTLITIKQPGFPTQFQNKILWLFFQLQTEICPDHRRCNNYILGNFSPITAPWIDYFPCYFDLYMPIISTSIFTHPWLQLAGRYLVVRHLVVSGCSSVVCIHWSSHYLCHTINLLSHLFLFLSTPSTLANRKNVMECLC